MKPRLSFVIIVTLFIACNSNKVSKEDVNSDNPSKIREIADIWFNHSAELHACFLQNYNLAKLSINNQLSNYKYARKPAVVLDLDETVLNNGPYQFKLQETGKEYTSKSWAEWVNLAQAKAMPGALDFVNFAIDKEVEIFYISNRSVEHLGATIKNLKDLSFPNADSTHILLKDKISNKTPRREIVSKDYEIILLIGDNLRDMSEEFGNRNKETMGKEVVDNNKELFGTKYIIMPNPMYGEWEKAIYNHSRKWSDEQKDSLRKLIIQSGY